MAHSTSDMRLVGGHPALDLANTVDGHRGQAGCDLLRSFSDLLVLARRTALLDEACLSALQAVASEHVERARAALKRAVALREAVYRVFLAEEVEQEIPSDALGFMQAVAREGRGRARLQRFEAGFAWHLPFDELEDVGRAFAIAAVDLLIAGSDRRRVRECKGDDCGWLFLDRSKKGHRIWCSDAGCGARSRVARFRAEPA